MRSSLRHLNYVQATADRSSCLPYEGHLGVVGRLEGYECRGGFDGYWTHVFS